MGTPENDEQTVKMIGEVIFKSSGWRLAWNQPEQIRLAKSILSLLQPIYLARQTEVVAQAKKEERERFKNLVIGKEGHLSLSDLEVLKEQ